VKGQEMRIPDLGGCNPDEAKALIWDSLRGPAYKAFIDARGKIAGEIPIAVLPQEYMESIGAKTDIVRLSAETLRAHRHHPEITTDDYLRSQTIIEQAQVVIQDGVNTMVFITMDDKYYHAVIKATKTGKALFMTSLRPTDKKDIERAKKTGKVIKNRLLVGTPYSNTHTRSNSCR